MYLILIDSTHSVLWTNNGTVPSTALYRLSTSYSSCWFSYKGESLSQNCLKKENKQNTSMVS